MRRRRILALLALLLLAAMVRYWAIDFGLPHTLSRPDEKRVVRILKSPWHAYNPQDFAYPSFYKYLVLGTHGLYYAAGRASGRFERPADLMAAYAINPYDFYLLNRLLAAALGTATVLALYLAAAEILGRRGAGLAAFFLALCFLHVRDSHFGVTDVPMTFFIVLTLLFVMKAASSARLRDYVLAGIACGLATSTKYSGAFMVVPMGLAHLASLHREDRRFPAGILDQRMLAFGLVAAVAFVAGTPYALFDSNFLADVAQQAKHLAGGHGLELERGWIYHLKVSLPVGLGWPVFAASLLGIPIFLRRFGSTAVLALAFPLVYYAIAGSGRTVFLRYTIPLLPFLCLTAAVAVDASMDRLRRGHPTAAHALTALLAILLISPSAYRIVQTNLLLGERDNRLIATEWVRQNIPGGSSIHQAASRPARLQLPRSFADMERVLPSLTRYWGRGWIAATGPGRSRGDVIGYRKWTYDPKLDRFESDRGQQQGSPDYVFVMESALPRYEYLAEGLRARLNESYERVKSFVAIDLDRSGNRFDPLDAFYVPYEGFQGIERPGPNIHIYRRRSDPSAMR